MQRSSDAEENEPEENSSAQIDEQSKGIGQLRSFANDEQS
jgi:hypothetical protein